MVLFEKRIFRVQVMCLYMFIFVFHIWSLTVSGAITKPYKYLIEFRGTHPLFRINEFQNIVRQVKKSYSTENTNFDQDPIEFRSIMSDPLSDVPLCIYTNLPSDEFAHQVARKSCLIRSIVKIYGEGKTAVEASHDSLAHSQDILEDNCFTGGASPSGNTNSWRVTFRRHGREGKSGLDPAGKRQRLSVFAPVLGLLNGPVDLVSPTRDLIYLEDWAGYVDHRRRILTSSHAKSSDITESSCIPKTSDISNEEESFSPSWCVFGRIDAEGPSISHLYELLSRPFIGTTTMDPLSSHLTAVSANIQAGDLVLDPYCGTGSLLIACAHLGANVIGSDFDSFNFGLDVPDIPTASSSDTIAPSKQGNRVFKRVEGRGQWGKTVFENFDHYNLTDRCVGMVNADSLCWVPLSKSVDPLKLDSDYYYFPTPSEEEGIELKSSKKSLIVSGLNTVQLVSKADSNPGHKMLENVFKIPFDTKFDSTASGRRVCSLVRNQLELVKELDAIVSDPPFGIREKAFGHAQIGCACSMGDNHRTVATLLLIARHRLKPGGRLAFWLPTDATVDSISLSETLREIEKLTHCDIRKYLLFDSATPQYLHSKLTRWLCIYEKKVL